MSDGASWGTTFYIRPKLQEERSEFKFPDLGTTKSWPMRRVTFELVDWHSDTVHGTYRTRKYAKKQARRKYKQLMRLMEKRLMSIE